MPSLTGTKKIIFEVAVELFSQRGYDGVSIREIARGAGIKESSIYNHFKNKEDIFNCILDCFQDGMQTQRPSENDLGYQIEYMTPREVFRLLFIQYATNRTPTIDRIAAIIFTHRLINRRAGEFVKEHMLREPVAYYEAILKRMAEKGRIRDDIAPRLLAEELHYGFLGIIFDLLGTALENGDPDSVIQKLSGHIDFVFDRLEKCL
jgi:AcrR family transcriptional regulator